MTKTRLFSHTHLTARDRRVVRAALDCGRLDSESLTTGKGRWAVKLKWLVPGRVLLYSDADGRGQKVYIHAAPTEAEKAADDAAAAEYCKLLGEYLMKQEAASSGEKNFAHVVI